jgi:hypothetical protein
LDDELFERNAAENAAEHDTAASYGANGAGDQDALPARFLGLQSDEEVEERRLLGYLSHVEPCKATRVPTTKYL